MTEENTKKDLYTPKDPSLLANLVGINDENLNILAEGLSINIIDTGSAISLVGPKEQVELGIEVLKALENVLAHGIAIGATDVVSATKMAEKGTIEYFFDLYSETLMHDAKGRAIRVKNMGQRRYVNAIKHHDVVFGIGPAGTGKTFLAVVMAVSAFKKGLVSRIVLTRPAVEAGESLGFLPGDLKEKIDPYLRPLYDSLYTVLGVETTNRLMERGTIEVAPLAYMRGRTLDEAFVILDEAQNTTKSQMKMFLTRLGFNSKMIVNGDVTQIDLPGNSKSGLIEAKQRLKNIEQIDFVEFSFNDVVRHPVVAKIIKAYESDEK